MSEDKLCKCRAMGRGGSFPASTASVRSPNKTNGVATGTTLSTTWLLLVIFCLVFISPVAGIQWLALSRVSTLAVTAPGPLSPQTCDSFQGSLVRQQVRFCKDNPAFMDSVQRGAIWAIDECQFQFRTRRWNCSTLNDEAIAAFKKHYKPKNTPDGNKSDKELEKKLNSSNEKLKKKRKSNRVEIPDYEKNSSLNSHVIMVSNKTERAVPVTSIPKTRGSMSSGRAAALSMSPSVSNHLDHDLRPITLRRPPKRKRRGRKRQKMQKQQRDQQRKSNKNGGIIGPYPIVPQGTREAAFVHAISSAGVAHAITRRCSTGELEDCGCDRSVRGVTQHGFRWSGCSDNIAYGVSLSKRFVDARDRKLVQRHKRKGKGVSSRALMNLHNNEAGRKLIEDNMRVECKCHGVSGSCELKTCWKAMPTFREIGEILKDKFDGATEVRVKQVSGRAELEPNKQYFKKPTELDLVYVYASPEYCELDIDSGSLGTHGRRCNKNSRGLDGCDLLCCNRGYSSFQEELKERCSCKFHWCCFVKCRTCTRNVTVHTCN